MKQKTLTILGVATIAVIGIAWFALQSRESAVQATTEKKKLYPDLVDSLNDVATITIQRNDGTYTIRRAGDTWGLADKDDYPVDVEAVRKTLIGVADMTIVEAKTKKADQLAKLDLQDPGEPGSKGVQMTLAKKDGAEVAKLVVGKEQDAKGAMLSNQRYVRKAGDPQAWLVRGTLDLKEKAVDWLQKKVLEVKRDRIRSIEVAHTDGEVVKVDREKAETQDFTLHDIPEGKDLTYPTAPGALASALEYLNLEDVLPADKVDFTQGALATTTFRTFDGLVVKSTVKDQDGKTYAKFEASYDAPPAPATPPEPPASDGEKKDETDAKKPATKSPEEVQKEVADLNARLSKWAYAISSYSKTSFAKRKSELLKDKAPPPAPKPEGDATKDGGEGAFAIPSDLPPEIQAQIKKDQEAKGNKTIVVDPATNKPPETRTEPPKEAEPPKDAAATDASKKDAQKIDAEKKPVEHDHDDGDGKPDHPPH